MASLTPAATAADPQLHLRHDLLAIRWCQMVGLPLFMDNGEPIDIVQDTREIAISADGVPSQARHLYLNARHPDSDTFDPQINGHSVAQWQGEILSVDTVGFSDKGVTRIPGGGWRTPTSHLIERYRLLDGDHLSVEFTWEDPAVYRRPHRYEFVYVRTPKGTSARTYRCDSSDPRRAQFFERALKGEDSDQDATQRDGK